jgi:hypothetical protein
MMEEDALARVLVLHRAGSRCRGSKGPTSTSSLTSTDARSVASARAYAAGLPPPETSCGRRLSAWSKLVGLRLASVTS